MAYIVKEIYFTLQGEGAQTGRPAVFLRFAGCNLWSGREEDRADAVCKFCDTDFVGTDGPGGGKYRTARDLATAVAAEWPVRPGATPYVVCTGGEPLLQLDDSLVDELASAGFEIAVETNGTVPVPAGVDWICVSPKAGVRLMQRSGHELKLVYPQAGIRPEDFEHLDFQYFSLQPMDGVSLAQNIEAAALYCSENARWRLSMQTHKLIGIP